MPELPDVEGFRRVLAKAVGHRIERVDVIDAGVLREVAAAELQKALTGNVFSAPRRHGKWLIGPVRSGRRHSADEPSVIFHFGMTGALSWLTDGNDGPDDERHQHDRVAILTERGELRYRDMRKLQGLRLPRDDGEVDDVLAGLGPDATRVTPAGLSEPLRYSRRQLKSGLMDQSIVAGLGNLLADEILWRARIPPQRHATELSDADWRRLHRRMRTVLRRSCEVGRVPPYSSWLTGRRDEPGSECPRCGSTLSRGRIGGRSTVWCPVCQPE